MVILWGCGHSCASHADMSQRQSCLSTLRCWLILIELVLLMPWMMTICT